MDAPEASSASPHPVQPAPPAPASALDRVMSGIVTVLALSICFFIAFRPVEITDFWWQARTGQWILDHRTVPARDPFSWTSESQPWLAHEWLTEIAFYLAQTRLPEGWMVAYKCGLAAAACGLVMLRCRLRGAGPVLSTAGGILAATALRNYADVRPQMLTFILLGLLLLGLDGYREGRWTRLPWLLPGLFLLWANLHGGVVIGLALLFIWVAGESLGAWLFRETSVGLKPLLVGACLSAAAVLVNPNGWHVYTYPFQVLGHPAVMDYIVEWYSPDFHSPLMRGFELTLLGTFGILAIARRKERRVGEVLVIAAMAHAALVSQRNTAPFALAAAPAAVAGLMALWNEIRPLSPAPALTGGNQRRWVASAAWGVVLAGVLWWIYPRSISPGEWQSRLTGADNFPRTAVALMRDGRWPGKLYNDYVWGGYLIWELWPARKVFIDGRAEVYYPTGAFDSEMRIHYAVAGFDKELDRWDVDVVLTRRNGNLAAAMARLPNWRKAFYGLIEEVHVRKGSQADDPVEKRSNG